MSNPYDGQIIAVNKPPGISSFSVVRTIRKAVGIKKVGHGGTLDPFAEGVLIIGIGRKATKQLGEFLKGEKEYIAHVTLGVVTDTYDKTGKVLERNPLNIEYTEIFNKRIEAVLKQFEGDILQVPPSYSAIKTNGVRAYKAARRGKEIKLDPRRVTISRIKLTGLTENGFKMQVICSHGTYIRSLGYDIGRKLGCGAHLGGLIRTRVGDYTLDNAVEMSDFIKQAQSLENTIWK